jgi:hypothetical protein
MKMKLSIWASEETMTLREYDIDFPIYSQWTNIQETYSEEAYTKFDYLEPAGLGIRLEKITIIKHEDFGEGEVKWSIESEELIWFDKMVMKENINPILGLEGCKLRESIWREIIIELKEFIRDII